MYGVWSVRAVAVVAAALILVPAALAQRLQDGSRQIDSRPTLGPIKFDQTGRYSLEGGSAPGAQVLVTVEGRFVGQTVANGAGAWRLLLPAPLPEGVHRVQVAARSQEDGILRQGELSQIMVPDLRLRTLSTSDDAAVERARSFADEATKVLDELMPVLERNGGALQVAQVTKAERSAVRASDSVAERDLYDRVVDWLDRAARYYSSTVVRALSSGSGGGPGAVVVADGGRVAAPRRAQVGSGVEKDFFDGLFDGVRRWFDRANKDYQGVIVRQLSEPAPTGAAVSRSVPAPKRDVVEAPRSSPPAADKTPAKTPERSTPKSVVLTQNSAGPEGLEWVQDRIGRWFGRANKDYSNIIVKQLSEPTSGRATELATVPRAPERIEPPKPAVPAIPKAEEIKRDDAARRAEQEQAQRLAELKADEDKKRTMAETARRAEADKKLAEDQDRQRLAVADAAQRAEAERRVEQERRAGQERQKAADDARRIASAEAAARAEAARREEQQRQRSAEEARKVAAAEAAQQAAARRAEDEERRRTAAAQRTAEERARREAAAPVPSTRAPARRAAERADASSRLVSAPRRVAKASPARNAYAKETVRSRTERRSNQAAARVQRARSGPAAARGVQPGQRGKARVRPYCGPRRSVMVTVPRVVVVEVVGGAYHSVFEKDYDRRRMVVASNSVLATNAAGGEACRTTIAVAPQ